MLQTLSLQQKQALQENDIVLLRTSRTLQADYELPEYFLRPARIKSFQAWGEREPTVIFALRSAQRHGLMRETQIYALGQIHSSWEKTETAYLSYLKQQAADGDANAMYALAEYYYENTSTRDAYVFEQGMTQAKHYYHMAMDAGHAYASYRFAEKYRLILTEPYLSHFAEDRQGNYQRYLIQSAEQGYQVAQYAVGYMYSYAKQGFPQDYAQCVYWYKKAAEQGYPEAMNNLGDKYEYGRGVPRDYVTAAYYYQQAVEQNIVEAIYNLGRLYLRGLGVEKDIEIGTQLLQRAADRCYQPARRKLKTLQQAK